MTGWHTKQNGDCTHSFSYMGYWPHPNKWHLVLAKVAIALCHKEQTKKTTTPSLTLLIIIHGTCHKTWVIAIGLTSDKPSPNNISSVNAIYKHVRGESTIYHQHSPTLLVSPLLGHLLLLLLLKSVYQNKLCWLLSWRAPEAGHITAKQEIDLWAQNDKDAFFCHALPLHLSLKRAVVPQNWTPELWLPLLLDCLPPLSIPFRKVFKVQVCFPAKVLRLANCWRRISLLQCSWGEERQTGSIFILASLIPGTRQHLSDRDKHGGKEQGLQSIKRPGYLWQGVGESAFSLCHFSTCSHIKQFYPISASISECCGFFKVLTQKFTF